MAEGKETADKNKAVVLISGGMDSLVTLAIAINQGYEPAALHLNYGQRTQQRELKAFNEICTHYGIKEKLIVDISHLATIGGSSLTDPDMEIKPGKPGAVPDSYVPFRNANILTIAVSWAEVTGADAIFIGAMEEDSSGYPDCRESFFAAFENAANLGTKPETNIKIIAPIIHDLKKDIILKGFELEAPFELSWSCYKNEIKACGVCDSCCLRLKGFKEAGQTDPIPYEI
ncbi:MAG: 7-cyano-7-deazaguanine synthase QueC [Candidatus Kapaibacterium sp.]